MSPKRSERNHLSFVRFVKGRPAIPEEIIAGLGQLQSPTEPSNPQTPSSCGSPESFASSASRRISSASSFSSFAREIFSFLPRLQTSSHSALDCDARTTSDGWNEGQY